MPNNDYLYALVSDAKRRRINEKYNPKLYPISNPIDENPNFGLGINSDVTFHPDSVVSFIKGHPLAQPQQTINGQPPAKPQQTIDDFSNSWQSQLAPYLSALYDTTDDEDKAKRQQKLARVNALSDAMRNIADAIYAPRGAMITQHDHRQTLSSLDKYQQMLDQIDAKKDRAKAMELNNKIHAMDMFLNIQQKNADWEKSKTFSEQQAKDAFTNQLVLKGMDYTHAENLADKELTAAKEREILRNKSAEIIADKNNETKIGIKTLSNQAAIDRATFKNDNFFQVTDGKNLHQMPKGIYWDIVAKASNDPELAADIKNVELTLNGEAAASSLNRLIADNWKRFYRIRDDGKFYPQLSEQTSNEIVSEVNTIFNDSTLNDSQKKATIIEALRDRGATKTEAEDAYNGFIENTNAKIITK